MDRRRLLTTATTIFILLAFLLSAIVNLSCVGLHGFNLLSENYPNGYFTYSGPGFDGLVWQASYPGGTQ
jgi:hypothetical protein